jgi:hypothetical protein
MIHAERKHIAGNRTKCGVSGDDYSALALSGGGIRSASFGLGVMQALVSAGVLKRLDYLSTVSGGGYIGSALTWFLKKGLLGGSPAGTDASNFPFGQPQTGARIAKDGDEANRNAALDFIRQRGNYLVPTKLLGPVSLAAVALRTSLASLLAYFLLMAVVMMAFIRLHLFEPVSLIGVPLPEKLAGLAAQNIFLFTAFAVAALFAVVSVLYSLITRLGRGSYRGRTLSQGAQGIMLQLVFWLCILGVLPFIADWMKELSTKIEAAGISTVLGTILGYVQHRRQRGTPEASPAIGMLAAFLLIYGLAFGAYAFAQTIVGPGNGYWIAAVIGAALLISLVVNTNYLSLHRGYRDRLMEAFLPDLERVREDRWGRATQADRALLQEMCQAPNERPYHLIGANVVLIDSPTSKYRGRGGDCFLFSPLYCGSHATGWIPTEKYMMKGGRGGMTLSTAMSVSGAAFNPNAGNSGQGLTHNRLVSTAFSLLNIRLGYWAANPDPKHSLWLQPNFIYPGLKGGVLGGAFREDRSIVELTDGGHFDNTGLYELIRRKLQLIILSDGGADPKFHFDDLGIAIERARVDFGVKIRFGDEEYTPQNLIPGSAQGQDLRIARYGLGKNPFALGSIEYPDRSSGILVYVKLMLVAGLPEDIYSYKAANEEFPHEPTADQLFDELQFEAYRELGYQLAWKMIEGIRAFKTEEKTTSLRKRAAALLSSE